MMTLYDCPTAPSPRRARILLAEKGVRHATVNIDLVRGEQLSEAYRAINPQCTVPALRLENGEVITENAGIAAYLEARYPAPALMGRTPEEKADVATWHWRMEFEGLLPVAEALRNSSPALAHRGLPGPENYEQIPALAERGLRRVHRFFEVLEVRLAGRDTVAGNGFSLADITAVVAVDFARIVRVKPGDQHANLRRWRAAMGERPSMTL